MDELADIFDKIPWTSFGRKTPISELSRSIVPVGNYSLDNIRKPLETTSNQDSDFENWILDIEGTAFQVGRGKLLTCRHVCKELKVKNGQAYMLSNSIVRGTQAKVSHAITTWIGFADPRFRANNPNVDAGLIICPIRDSPEMPYDVPVVRWGDSTQLGVGDRVLIGGFPLGKDMFVTNTTNRGLVQPTFYDGIISAILPATKPKETRLLQISSVAMGGISGGVVCCPDTGFVLGMVTSGITSGGVSLPITYAIPSEVLQPWSDAVNFTAAGEIWR